MEPKKNQVAEHETYRREAMLDFIIRFYFIMFSLALVITLISVGIESYSSSKEQTAQSVSLREALQK